MMQSAAECASLAAPAITATLAATFVQGMLAQMLDDRLTARALRVSS